MKPELENEFSRLARKGSSSKEYETVRWIPWIHCSVFKEENQTAYVCKVLGVMIRLART